MTWGEWKLVVLQKIFSNDGATLSPDDNNQDYINAMPGVFNEAVHILLTRGKPLIQVLRIEGRPNVDSPRMEDGILLMPIRKESQDVELREWKSDAFRVREDGLNMLRGYSAEACLIGQTAVRIWAGDGYTLEVRYQTMPERITGSWDDNGQLPVPDEIAVPAVLYAASELYKEDDIQLSTQWRNQFETELENLQSRRIPQQRSVRKTSGWW